MRRLVLFLTFVFLTRVVSAQNFTEHYYFSDISVDYGIAATIGSQPNRPVQSGNTFNISAAHFFSNNIGYRVGFSHVSGWDGAESLYSVPIYINYRSKIGRSEYFESNAETFSELIFEFVSWIIPKNYEIFAGGNFGNFKAGNYNSLSLVWDEYGEYNQGFLLTKEFFSSIEGGGRLNYRIWRFGVVFSPTIGYSLTKNFVFETDNELNNFVGYSPRWFVRLTIGLSFAF